MVHLTLSSYTWGDGRGIKYINCYTSKNFVEGIGRVMFYTHSHTDRSNFSLPLQDIKSNQHLISF